MSIESWSIVWKFVFFMGVSLFAILSVLVITGGARDIKNLIHRLKEDSKNSSTEDDLSDEE